MKKGMKRIWLVVLLTTLCGNLFGQADYPYAPVPFNRVTLTDRFWKPKLKINTEETIPFCLKKCEETGRVKNFSIAARQESGVFCTNYAFDDTDVYKSIEAASY